MSQTRATLARALWLFLASALAVPAGAAPAPIALGGEDVARYAIIIGHNGGGETRTPLRFADDDAARLFKLLLPSTKQSWLLTTFDTESARLYPSLTEVARQPTRGALAQILGEVNWALNERRSEGVKTELVVFFAGHGDVDVSGQGFLVLADGPFTRTDLENQIIAGSRADTNHIVIDACASYYMVGRGSDQSGAVTLSPGALDVLRGDSPNLEAARARTGVLVSTSDASEVHESAALRGGLFSHLLRSALSGSADTDEDGRIEYAEAAAFFAGASSALRDPRARLKIFAAAPAQRPHAELTDLRRSGADHFLAVDSAAQHVRVLDEDGAPYAELHPTGGRVMLALNGSRMYVVQIGQQEAVLVPRRAGAYALSALQFGPAVAARGGLGPFEGLFSQPFGKVFLDGFVASSELQRPNTGAQFEVAFADGYEPPTRFPWMWLGAGTLAAAGGLAVITIGAVVGNAVAFAALDASYRQSGRLDPDLALAVEGFRIAALTAAVGAGALTVGGGALFLLGFVEGGDE